MRRKLQFIGILLMLSPTFLKALSPSDVNIKLISGYYWLDNSCSAAGPQGKVTSFSIVNISGTTIRGLSVTLDSLKFSRGAGVTYSTGTPSFNCQTMKNYYLGDLAPGDTVTAFFFIGYNCLIYPNNTNLTSDFLTHYITVKDNNSGVVNVSQSALIYVMRNANNNTITILATSLNTVGTRATLSVAYNISNVKPSNIIDMQISTLPTFPPGYEIMGCKITASTIPADFPVGLENVYYSDSIKSNLPSGGSVTIEWELKITSNQAGLNSSNLVPFVVSDAGSAQRWQANVTTFTGTSIPVNPIVIEKRVDKLNNLINDTVTYTIVIHNTSAVADVTIDQLVDHLPRDYEFRFIDSDSSIHDMLVTYDNSTQVPEFLDTSYLFIKGNKNMGGGFFSWLIPAQDSIKFVYSAKVSSTPGMNDTNFINAYVGTSSVGEAFARVNVFSVLPFKLLGFKAQAMYDKVLVNWKLADIDPGTTMTLYRMTDNNVEGFEVQQQFVSNKTSLASFQFVDQGLNAFGNSIHYKLMITESDGNSKVYFCDVLTEASNNGVTIANSDNIISIFSLNGNQNLQVEIYDANGRNLYSNQHKTIDGYVEIPFDFKFIGTQLIFVNVSNSKENFVFKIPNVK
jgi:uncharacterized repeat protein (TIGR01451 family)